MNNSGRLRLQLIGRIGLMGVIIGASPVRGQQQGSGSVVADPAARIRKEKPPALTPSEGGVTSVPEDFAKVRLSPGVLLHFGVYNAPEMEATLRVASDGSILVPLAGSMQVAGMTITEARVAIRTALVSGEFIKDPQVSLDIVQLAPGYVTILGEVQTPGKFQILSAMPLQSALALAGGETLEAGDDIEVRHPGGVESVVNHLRNVTGSNRDSVDSITVVPGDTVTVKRAGIIYVLGAVHRPGGYLMLNKGSLNLLEAVSLAGGTMLEAADAVRILHRHDDQVVEEKIKYSDMTVGRIPPPALGDKDIVYVPSSKTKSVFVNGAVIIGAAASSLLYRVP
jgi:polysaccharide export outer membrane protein